MTALTPFCFLYLSFLQKDVLWLTFCSSAGRLFSAGVVFIAPLALLSSRGQCCFTLVLCFPLASRNCMVFWNKDARYRKGLGKAWSRNFCDEFITPLKRNLILNIASQRGYWSCWERFLLCLRLPLTLGKRLSPCPGFPLPFCEARWYLPALGEEESYLDKVLSRGLPSSSVAKYFCWVRTLLLPLVCPGLWAVQAVVFRSFSSSWGEMLWASLCSGFGKISATACSPLSWEASWIYTDPHTKNFLFFSFLKLSSAFQVISSPPYCEVDTKWTLIL